MFTEESELEVRPEDDAHKVESTQAEGTENAAEAAAEGAAAAPEAASHELAGAELAGAELTGPEPGAETTADADEDDDEPIDSDYYSSDDYEYVPPAPVAPVEPQLPQFDLAGIENPSFAMIQAGRVNVFTTRGGHRTFTSTVEEMDEAGEPGRRKGLGLWMLARYEDAEAQLANYTDDDVATYTRARGLMSLSRPNDAQALFDKLAAKYPEEPRPKGGSIEASLESELAKLEEDGDPAAAIELVEKALDAASPSFRDSADGHYLAGRMHELARRFEHAIDHYRRAFELDPDLRSNMVHGAYLAERCGLDEMALELYERLVKLNLADRQVFLNLGVLYEDLGRDQDAAACYDVVVNQFPTDTRARLYLQDAKSAMVMYYDEDLERKEDKLNQILRIPITDFELSVRARNCLNKMQIHTLGDLVTKTEQELLSYKNFGETSLNEIKEILRSKGLRLGMPREEAVASIESRARRSAPAGAESSDVHDKPITDLQLSIRARRTVEALGCLTVGDIVKHSADELLGMPNFGTTSLQELRSKLVDMGAKLTGE